MKEINLIYITEIAKTPIYQIEDKDGYLVMIGQDNQHKIYRHMNNMKEVIDFINIMLR